MVTTEQRFCNAIGSESMTGVHWWKRNKDKTATCKRCGRSLSAADADQFRT